MIPRNFQYDIFISYRFIQRDWAETLAHNLVAQGYKVFIDVWELYGGQHFTKVIDRALKASRCAILIATPEAADSGWVQREYELMFKLEDEGAGFFFIPIVWGEFSDFPFLETLHVVDFGNGAGKAYREAFQCLLSALKKQAPGPEPYFDGMLKFPVTTNELTKAKQLAEEQRSFVDNIFSYYVYGGVPVMVLAQDGFKTQHYAQAIKQKAIAHYGAKNVLHLFPPTSVKASTDQYFARLGRQCGFVEDVSSSWEWEGAVAQRLQEGDELFLFVTGFENGPEDARLELAGELRGLVEMYPMNFRLIVMGGERLAAMKYELGDMSFLNKLEEMPLPSVCLEDLRTLYPARQGEFVVTDELLRDVLLFSGQHPRLVDACLRALRHSQSDWQTEVMASGLPAQLFARFQANDHSSLCERLSYQDLGRYSTWPQDELVRSLYWQNLLCKNDKGRLVWRSELIRVIGKEWLGCSE